MRWRACIRAGRQVVFVGATLIGCRGAVTSPPEPDAAGAAERDANAEAVPAPDPNAPRLRGRVTLTPRPWCDGAAPPEDWDGAPPDRPRLRIIPLERPAAASWTRLAGNGSFEVVRPPGRGVRLEIDGYHPAELQMRPAGDPERPDDVAVGVRLQAEACPWSRCGAPEASGAGPGAKDGDPVCEPPR